MATEHSEYDKTVKEQAERVKRLNTERAKAKLAKENAKKAAQLRDQISKNNAIINNLQTSIKNAEVLKKGHESDYITALRASLNPSGPGGATQTTGELTAIGVFQGRVVEQQNVINNAKNNIKNLTNSNNAIVKQFSTLSNIKATNNYNMSTGKSTTATSPISSSTTGGGGKGGGNERKPEEQKPKGPYKYNFPLIKPARFSTASNAPLNSSLGDRSVLVDVPAMSGNNAENYWINNSPGRGVLRVNREYMKNILNNKNKDAFDPNKLDTFPGVNQRTQDKQLYGFRFLYNPEKIQMIYDVNTDLHPGLLQSGQDRFLPLTKSSSAISLDLVLNRIEDMKYKSDPRLAIRNQVYFGAGETESILPDILEIHEKGTMYDIEYLFKTMNAPHATFNSTYNGKTADMGFIRPTILELHLGNRLRYPVRVLNLSIEHKIFDPRMVPTFSIVRIAFARFIEFETKKEIGGGGGGGARRLL